MKYGWLQGPIVPNLMGLLPHDVAIVWTYRDGAFIWCRSGLHSTLHLALHALESDHLEKLQARSEFTAFSHKDGSTANSLESCADSWLPEVYISPRISHWYEQFLEQSVPNSASRSHLTWLFRYTEITPISLSTDITRIGNRRIRTCTPLARTSLVPRPRPLTRKRVWWLLSNFLVVPTQQYWFWTNIDYILAWRKAYFIGSCARLDDVALFHWIVQDQDCWLSTTKKSLNTALFQVLATSGCNSINQSESRI